MILAFTFGSGTILAEGKCVSCGVERSQELEVPALMISTVGIVNAMFRKKGTSNRLEIKVPGEYLCEVCSSKLKAVQNAEYTNVD